MKTLSYALVACAFGGLAATSGQAQFSFNSGSNGSYGPMAITTNTTLELPPDGKFHCTTINVASNATLRFTPNALNTPVYLLATGDVAINGMVDVSGKTGYYYAVGGAGGPGGFAGGRAAFSGLSQGDGYGPGGGKKFTFGGSGSYRSSIGDAYCGSVYGSPLLMPVVGGSGGGADMGVNCSGGGGGVGVLVAAATRITITGTIVAQYLWPYCLTSLRCPLALTCYLFFHQNRGSTSPKSPELTSRSVRVRRFSSICRKDLRRTRP
jgi:hypothetical protein